MKHILVISQYFYPEQFRINDICKEWINKGYNISVLTGIPNYPEGKYYQGYGIFKKRKETFDGINIIRIPLIPRGNNSLMLVLNYFSFVISGLFFSLFSHLNPDLVFIYEVSPMTQALPGIWFAKRKKIPCILYVMDLWPENVEMILGVKSKAIIGSIEQIVNYIYRYCNKILVSSKRFIPAIEKRGVIKDKIVFWPQYAEDFYTPLLKKDNSNSIQIPQDSIFNLVFAGNIGQAQGLNVLLETALILKRQDVKVRFNIIGDGRAKGELVEAVLVNHLSEYFNFIDKQPAILIPQFIAACHAALICLSKSQIFEMTLPAKLQSYMACCTPIIVCADGEVAAVINEAKAGLCAPAGDSQKLADVIIKMKAMTPEKLVEFGENAGNYYKAYFEKNMLLKQIDEIFFKEIACIKSAISKIQ